MNESRVVKLRLLVMLCYRGPRYSLQYYRNRDVGKKLG